MIPDSAEVDAAVHITLTRSQQPSAVQKGRGALLQPTALEVQVCLVMLLGAMSGIRMQGVLDAGHDCRAHTVDKTTEQHKSFGISKSTLPQPGELCLPCQGVRGVMLLCCSLQELEVLSLPQRASAATPASTPDQPPTSCPPEFGPASGSLCRAAQLLSPLEDAVHQLRVARSAARSLACNQVGWLAACLV